jgi:Domain of unknown function (DUF4258)
MNFEFSTHALEQMDLRGISKPSAEFVLSNPDQIVEDEDGIKVYQSVGEEKKYLIRIFVNERNLVVTAYKTSKIKKYYEGKI